MSSTAKEQKLIQLLGESWYNVLKDWFDTDESKHLMKTIHMYRKQSLVTPFKEDVFSALRECPYEDTKVMVVGTYPEALVNKKGKSVSHGLAYSSQIEKYLSDSLKVIFSELDAEHPANFPPCESTQSYNLTRWANQGVMLLNEYGTISCNSKIAHMNIGWDKFFVQVLHALRQKPNMVYLLWGDNCKKYVKFIEKGQECLLLRAAHPSVHRFSTSLPTKRSERGWKESKCFLGCGHFRQTNEYLEAHNKTPIEWIQENTGILR